VQVRDRMALSRATPLFERHKSDAFSLGTAHFESSFDKTKNKLPF
jgi:hypothetical protein